MNINHFARTMRDITEQAKDTVPEGTPLHLSFMLSNGSVIGGYVETFDMSGSIVLKDDMNRLTYLTSDDVVTISRVS